MSIIAGKGFLITVVDTEVGCPICTFRFDASKVMAKAKDPVFKTKCPACKGATGISEPIYGGNTTCFEWDKRGGRHETVTPQTINGKPIEQWKRRTESK